SIEDRSTLAFDFPDTVADFAPSPSDGLVLVSCWDGRIYLLDRAGGVSANLQAGSAARLAWSDDGVFAVAGTAEGRLLRLERTGALAWHKEIPVTEVAPPSRPPSEVVAGLPIFQGGRIPQGEHAYVGDIWVIKSGRDGVVVDDGGLSGFSITQAR